MQVRVLGPIELRDDRGSIELPAAMSRRLIAALAVEAGRVRSVDALIDSLWGEHPPASAEKLVQVHISRLRRMLPAPALIVTRPQGYLLDLPGHALDTWEFERLVAEGSEAAEERNPALAASRFRRAVELWRGDAFGEFAYEQFVRAEVERLEEMRRRAVVGRFDAELMLGHHAAVLPELRRLAIEQPIDEDIQAQLMLALYRSGRRAESLAVFGSAAARLREELEEEPGDRLLALHRLIVDRDPGLARAEPPVGLALRRRLTSPPNPLLGRERELAELRGLLEQEDIRFIVLTGAGGSGKTRLALETARMVAPSFANGAVLVELAAIREAGLLLPTILRAIRVPSRGNEPLDRLVDTLRSQELLLVLDNVEQLIPGTTVIVELLARTRHVKVLVTSRVVLHLSGEHVYPVDPLAADAAFALFVERARQADYRFRLGAADADLIREACARIDRLPLAIELAAARTPSLSPAQLVEQLDRRLPLLAGGPHDLAARQRTLESAVGWSEDLLDDAQRRLFRRLSVFAGGFSAAAAASVCLVEGDADAGLLALRGLAERSLLVGPVDRDGRYAMLETIREYASSRFQGAVEEHGVRLRHAEFLTRRAEQIEPLLTGPGQNELMDELELEHDNVRTAIEWAIDHAPPVALRLAGSMWRFWLVRGYTKEGLDWTRRALAAATGEPRVRSRALTGAGMLAAQRDVAAAERHMTEVVALAHEIGDRRLLAESLQRLGRLALVQDHYAAASGILGEALSLSRDVRHSVVTADALFDLACIDTWQGRHPDARARVDESLAIATTAGNERTRARCVRLLGAIAYAEGDLVAAQARATESLAANQKLGDRNGEAFSLHSLGLIAAATGDNVRARMHHERSLEIRREIDDGWGIVVSLARLAGLAVTDGDPEAARRLLEEGLEIYLTLGDTMSVAVILDEWAAVELALGRPDRAACLLGAVGAIHASVGWAKPRPEESAWQRRVGAVRAVSTDAKFERAWTEGQAMTMQEAIDFATGSSDDGSPLAARQAARAAAS